MTKVFHIYPDSRAKMEKVRLTTRLIEMPDGPGYHPVNPEAIWYDDQQKGDSMMFVWHGIVNPHGSLFDRQAVSKIEEECEMAKRNRRPLSVSKIWQRQFARAINWFIKYGLTTGILAFILITLFKSTLEG